MRDRRANAGTDACSERATSAQAAASARHAAGDRARTSGPLKGLGTCDPDGDGSAGVDYNGDGVNDTSWTDISGATVNCLSTISLIDVGALQGAGGGQTSDTTPPGNVQGLQRTDKN